MDLNWNIKLMGQRIINFNGKNWMNLELSSDSKIRKTETEKLYKRTIIVAAGDPDMNRSRVESSLQRVAVFFLGGSDPIGP